MIFHGRCCGYKEADVDAVKALKRNWLCPGCEKARRVLPANDRPASPMKTHTLPTDSLAAIMEQLSSMANEIKIIKTSLPSSISEDMRDVKNSLEKQGEVLFENGDRLRQIETRLDNQTKIFEELVLENNNLKARIKDLEAGLNRAEQELRCKSLEIRGIPVREGEVPAALVTRIGAGLGLKLEAGDLDTVERLRPRRDDPRPPVIIAKFVRKSMRDELVRLRKVHRDFTTRHIGWEENDSHPIYLSEDMSPMNRRLYYLARQKRAAGKLKYVWFGGGRVRCRRDDGQPVIIINSPDDLDIFA